MSRTDARAAAIFDLDRTLLAGASGQVLAEAMRAAGVLGRALPGEKAAYALFNVVGENLPSMALARQAAALAKGRSREAVQGAAAVAAEALAALVQPYAHALIDEHRAAGRPVVLATTTPYDMVKPLADRLGFDELIATRYGVRHDGAYDGSVDGPFVWSLGKLRAVRAWAEREGIDLAASYAYSDSVYDTPLLSAVGHPVVVNPDPRLAAVAWARRWPIRHLDVPPDVPKLPVLGIEPQRLALALCRPELFPYARFDIAGVEQIPPAGGVILCANHRSYFDVATLAVLIGKSGRTARFLAKKEVLDAPIVGPLARALGGIRVERGSGSDEPLAAAENALRSGQLVALMPQGTIPRGQAFFSPTLKGRWGAARLAAATGCPVVPVGLWGTERVWPRSARFPTVWNVLDAPAVRVRVGPPVQLLLEDPDDDTKRILKSIVKLLPPEARRRHTPTVDELRRTFPPGYRGPRTDEAKRRPGSD